MRSAVVQQREWVIARTRMVFPSNTPAVPERHVIRWSTPQPTLVDQILGACIATQSFVAHTDLVRRVGGWNPALSLWDDYELGLRLLLASPHPAWCEGVFHQIVQHPDSITGSSYRSKAQQIAPPLLSLVQLLCDSGAYLSYPQQQEALSCTALSHAHRGRSAPPGRCTAGGTRIARHNALRHAPSDGGYRLVCLFVTPLCELGRQRSMAHRSPFSPMLKSEF